MIIKTRKHTAAIFLWMAAIFFLTACAGREKEKIVDNTESGVTYQADITEMDLMDGADYSIQPNEIAWMDGRIYLYVHIEAGKNGNGRDMACIISYPPDGSESSVAELTAFQDGETGLMLTADDQNQLHLFSQVYKDNAPVYYLHTLNSKGVVTDTVKLEMESSSLSMLNSNNQLVVCQDTVYFVNGHDTSVYTFDKNGKAGKVFKNNNRNIQAVFRAGTDVYLYENAQKSAGFRKLDLETGEVGKLISPEKSYNPSNVFFSPGEDGKIYINSPIELCSYDFATGIFTKILKWINIGVDSADMIGCFPWKDGSFFAIRSPYEEKEKWILISRADTSETKEGRDSASETKKEKTVLTFACLGLDSQIKDEILSFNQSHKDIYIEVKDYDTYEDARERMKLDFTTGQIPDIVDARFSRIFSQLAKKGMFTDLYALMEKDGEISREDFIPSILETLEIDGKLYGMGPLFYINGLGSSEELIGDTEGFTAEEMIAAYKKMPKGSAFIANYSNGFRQNFIPDVLHNQMEEYLDQSTGKAHFTDKSFLHLMEFAKLLPDQKEEQYMADLVSKGRKMMQDKTLLFESVCIDSFNQFQYYYRTFEKMGGFRVVNYPSKDGNNKLSMSLTTGGILAITEDCKNKEAAWEFLRTFFTYEYQKNKTDDGGLSYFPTRQDAFDKKLEYAMATEAYTDEDGTKVEPLHIGFSGVTPGPFTEEESEALQALVSRIGISSDYNDEYDAVIDIVSEELDAYFAGDRNTKKTAELIQNRFNLYISENS